jgi:hypothetical protein
VNANQLIEQAEEKPVVIALSAQEIGALHAARTNPDDFRQYLLQKFKAAGVRVEGTLYLRLAYGEIARFRKEAQPGVFHYVFLPESHAYALREKIKSEIIL